ncbi:metallophosphoesterase family protein [Rhizosaccharibacter radicis]|uniref:Metallophosphoesterase family protein n=1 Tax=Rhizosaccharibacter radicis TaxID=2782605 RepID=A0ABT1VZV1_9PROT|nr:metallophosphoesterase family protein [Acetobacteraceae bacterium KSS12]
MAVFFTADTHWGHGGARGLFRRPFGSLAETDAAMIARWRDIVAPDDEVWHLGDVAVGLSPEKVAALIEALPGRKHLVPGNNDGPGVAALSCWASVSPYVELEQDGRLLVLCHYPLRSWRDMHRGAVNLHGHSHGRLAPLARQFDVGVDAREFRPVRLGDLMRPARCRAAVTFPA